MRWPRPLPVVGDQSSAAERRSEPAAWRFSAAERAAIYDVIAARRDVRRFRPDPLDPSLVRDLLRAAHAAPSVGHSQPWRFVLVTKAATRDRAAVIAERERLRQANSFSDEAARKMLDLQLDGIREAPLGIVVCCDRRTQGAGVLGRATFADADIWSCACAIENLWLTARAEGLGLGWVTLFPPEELAGLIGLPEGIETLGWLCLGWPDERPPAPGLERAGWSRRLELDDVIIHETWSGTGPEPPPNHLRGPEQAAVVAARDDADALLSTPGSLGVIDRVLDRLGALGVTAASTATLVLAAADHPVVAHGVSTYAPAVTREVLEACIAGESLGAAAARAIGVPLVAIDAGVTGEPVPGAIICRPQDRRGDIAHEDALTRRDVDRLVEFGRELAASQIPAAIVALGEVGIGNTTLAAALASVLLDRDPTETVGLGASGDSATLARKASVVQQAVSRMRAIQPIGTISAEVALSGVGGPEIALLAGVVLGVASRGGIVVIDGFATSLSALCALRIEPAVAAHLVAGQRSRELGQRAVLDELGLEALLDLRLRAGEGVGAIFATQLVVTALEVRKLSGRTG